MDNATGRGAGAPGPHRSKLVWIVVALLGAIVIAGIWSSGRQSHGEAIRRMNEGVALLEQYRYKDALDVFEPLAAEYPDWAEAHVNRGIAALNMATDESLEEAEAAFRAALDLKPDSPHALVSFGMLLRFKQRTDEALDVFRRLVDLVPNDPHALYFLGEALGNAEGRDKELELMEKVIRLQPSFGSAWYRLRGKLPGALDEFKRLDNDMLLGAIKVGNKYGEGGEYNLAVRDSAPPGSSVEAPPWKPEPLPVFDAPQEIAPAAVVATRPDGRQMTPAMALGDVNGDAALDLVLCGQGDGGGRIEIFAWRGGRFESAGRIERAAVVCALGDLDGDTDVDLVAAGENGLWAYRNDGKGGFEETPLSGAPAPVGFPVRLYLIDADSDWDLDIACLWQVPGAGSRVNSKLMLLNNNRDAGNTFSDIAATSGIPAFDFPAVEMAFADWDGDVDLDLLIFDGASGKPRWFANDRVWRYRAVEPLADLAAPGVVSMTGGDLDGDGDQDLLLFCDTTLRVWTNQRGLRFTEDPEFRARHGALGGTAGVLFDFRNTARQSLVVLDPRARDASPPVYLPSPLAASRARDLPLPPAPPGGGLSAVAAAVAADGQAMLLVYDTARGARAHALRTPGTWIALELNGPLLEKVKPQLERANYAAIGATVEVRAGNNVFVMQTNTGSGGTARSAPRCRCGLGGAPRADYVRILWPDGILQSELALSSHMLHRIIEVERKPSSCPVLFAWNGDGFEFVADFLGVGGLGYFLRPGQYSTPDATEILWIPRLEPRPAADGGEEYELRALEPLEETTYLDQASLVVVDHPEDVHVLPLEMFAVSAPAPEYELLAFSDRLFPHRALDQSGSEVSAALLERDAVYAPRLEPHPRFRGFLARPQAVELEFGPELDALMAGEPGEARRPVLFLHGYIEYGDSTSNFAAWQAGLRASAPTFSVERGGRWVPLREEWGFPSGYPKWMAVDLGGLLAPGDRRLRIETNLEIAWDQIFLARAGSAAHLRPKELKPRRADLVYRGFPVDPPPGEEVEGFLYRDFRPREHFKAMPGNFTRFGDVRELLDERDDRFVVFGPGDEIRLTFPALETPAAGTRRSFFWKCAGYCKDMDLYTAHSEGTGPLPFRAMRSYPHAPGERYPAELEPSLERWNTRRVSGTPMTPVSPPR